jgi:hypothetical protein
MPIAHALPTGKPARSREVVTFEGVNYPLVLELGKGWRMRSRSIHRRVDYFTGTLNKAVARRLCLAHLAELKTGKPRPTTRTLEDVVACYHTMAKRAGMATEKLNIRSLRQVVQAVTGKDLRHYYLHDLGPDLWAKYQAIKQGLPRVDLSIRRAAHTSINTTVRAAVSMFIPKLRPGYERAGLTIPTNTCSVQWLQTLKRRPAGFREAEMLDAWAGLTDQRALWFAVALARFAGLRKEEIGGCRGGWLVRHDGVWCLEIRDRESEGWYTKTGAHYFAMITHPALIEALQAVPPDDLVIGAISNRTNWLDRGPQQWLRPFMGTREEIYRPLHRLRAAYLASIQREALIEMQQAATRKASAQAGHTQTTTTSRHYLPASIAS